MIFKRYKALNDITTLLTGGALLQILDIISAPIIGKIYSPQDFAVLTLFLSIISPLKPLTTFKYEQTLFSTNDKVLRQKLASSTKQIIKLSSILFLIFFVATHLLTDILPEHLGNTVFIIPLWLYFFGNYQLSLNYKTIQKSFRLISISKLSGGILNIISKILLGYLYARGSTLIVSEVLCIGLSSLLLKVKNIKKTTLHESATLLKKYKDYPIFNASASFLNLAAQNTPIYIIPALYDEKTLGLYGFAFKYLAIPINFLGMSISRVLSSRLTSNIESGQYIKHNTYKTFYSLLIMSVVIYFSFRFFLGDILLEVMPNDWRKIKDISTLVLPIFLVRFTVAPCSIIFIIKRKLNISFKWQLSNFITTICFIAITPLFLKPSFENFVQIYLIHEIISYSIYIFLIFRTIKEK